MQLLKTSNELRDALERKRCTINIFLSRLMDKGKIKKVGFKKEGVIWGIKNG